MVGRQRTLGAGLAVLVCALVFVADARPLFLKHVDVGTRRYLVVNATYAASLLDSPYAKMAAAVTRHCRTAGAWGFADGSSVGLVVWLPRDPSTCLGQSGTVSGGGPGPPEPCVQFVRNSAFYELIVASNATACSDLSTEVPSGTWVTASTPTWDGAIAAGTRVLVKCQLVVKGTVSDFVVVPTNDPLPTSTAPHWLTDAYVRSGVPRCSGFDASF